MATDSKPVVEIYTDGACLGNPGPGGWGVLLIYGEHRKKLYGSVQDTTNNRMELRAAIESLKALKRPSEVVLYTDSSYVQKGMLEWLESWKKRNWKTANKKPVKNADLWQELDEVCQSHQVSWRWVKGHAGNEGNEIADELASKGAEEAQAAEGLL